MEIPDAAANVVEVLLHADAHVTEQQKHAVLVVGEETDVAVETGAEGPLGLVAEIDLVEIEAAVEGFQQNDVAADAYASNQSYHRFLVVGRFLVEQLAAAVAECSS